MRRHETLTPLSRDHHDGLFLATRLQQGNRALLRLWSHDPEWQAGYIVRFYEEDLTPHFEAEEKVLFPLAKKYVHDPLGIIDRLRTEHELMRSMVDLFRHPEPKSLPSALVEFGTVLEKHIRCEERELFPLCEKTIPPKELEQAGASIARYRPSGAKP
jgi:hemerythrin-like domain-containing protein